MLVPALVVVLVVVSTVAANPVGYGGLVQPGPAVEYTYPVKAPVGKCPHNLLISCDEHHKDVPCSPAHHHQHQKQPYYQHRGGYDRPGRPEYYEPAGYPGYGYEPESPYDDDDEEYKDNEDKYRMGKWMKKYFKLKSRRHRFHKWRRDGSELDDSMPEDDQPMGFEM